MKTLKMRQLDEKDEEIVDALVSLGTSRPAARVLAYLQQVNEATSVDIEAGTVLRQPEVSIAMKQLQEPDWITEREEKKQGKGRPYKIYSLKIGFKEIISQLENQQKKTVEESQAKIERLKELIK